MAKQTRSLDAAWDAVKRQAAAYEGAWEDHPWGETVYKVGKKVFVFTFLGAYAKVYGDDVRRLNVSVKLPDSGDDALALPFAQPTGYGLGKSGWVTCTFKEGETVPVPLLLDWLKESYTAIAPKRRVAAQR